MKFRQCLLLFVATAATLGLSACGRFGGSSLLTSTLQVSFLPQLEASLPVGAASSFTAVVSNDSKKGGVIWKATCGAEQCGSFDPSSTPSATPTIYTAPAAIPPSGLVTVIATSVSDATKSVSATVAITATQPVLSDSSYIYHLAE